MSAELIPFSLLSMGLSFIGIGFLLPFYKEGSFLSRRNPHNLGFLLRGTAKLIEKRSYIIMLGVPPLLSHIFDGLLPKGEEGRVLHPDYGVKMRSEIMEHRHW